MCLMPVFFLCLRTTDDDATTQKKVALLLERVNKIKWRTAENVEEEEKVCVGMRCLIPVHDDWMSLFESNNETMFPSHVGLWSWGQPSAGETCSTGERSARPEAKTGNRDEGVVQSHPADSLLKHSLPIPVTDAFPFCCCVAQNEKTLAKACEKARTEKKKLEEELAKSQEELCKLRDRLADVEAELQSTKQE